MKKSSIMHTNREIGGHVKAEERTVTSDFGVHWHTYFEIELVLEGEAVHYLNGESRKIGRGSLVFIAPTDFHGIKPLEPMKLWNVSFDESQLSEKRLAELASPSRRREFMLDEKSINRAVSLMEMLSEEAYAQGGGCSRELCECLLTLIYRNDSEKASTESPEGSIGRALLYLNMHFRDAPSLAHAAAQAGMHPHYFSEEFKRVTGMNFSKYLSTLKTDYAKILLKSGFSVAETCHRSGFGSLSNFLSVFKRQTGISPKEYKKKFTQI